MLFLQMKRAELASIKDEPFETLLSSVPQSYRPLIHPTVAMQAKILNLAIDSLRTPDRRPSHQFEFGPHRIARKAEIFTDGASLVVVAIFERLRERGDQGDGNVGLYLYYIGPHQNAEVLQSFEEVAKSGFGVTFERHYYVSERFKELQSEGRGPPENPSDNQLAGAKVLCDRGARTLAIAIKTSGGLLVRDLPKQLPPETRDQTEEIQKALLAAGLIDAEIVVVCSRTQAQTARVPSRAVLEELSSQGLKCACGRPIINERIEEALTITDHGRGLLDGSRWLTFLLLQELKAIGIPPERILVEQHAGGDEMDLLADISGELTFFELKDKEFNLGNAYSFGAKIGIIRPEHPIIVTTEYVGNDAKEHFQRARRARTRSGAYYYAQDIEETGGEQSTDIRYIEGLENLPNGLRRLASTIYSKDARRILNEVLPLASLDSQSLVSAIDSRDPFAGKEEERPVQCTPQDGPREAANALKE